MLCVLPFLALGRCGRAVDPGRAGPKRPAHDVNLVKGSLPAAKTNYYRMRISCLLVRSSLLLGLRLAQDRTYQN